MTEPILAAGVVLIRSAPTGPEVLVVHRPGHADWSLPKGKLDPGEGPIAAAVRECSEETGLTPVLRTPLPTVSYAVDGTPKVVRYWRATPSVDDGFAPDTEVDEVRWVPTDDVDSLLTYEADRRTVAAAVGRPETVPLVVLRHAAAVKRADFDGPTDADRPLTGKGRTQAKALVDAMTAFGIAHVHTSPAYRCRQTVEPVAVRLGVRPTVEDALGEESHATDTQITRVRAAELAADLRPIVVCTHRPVLPDVLATLAQRLGTDVGDVDWAPALSTKLPPGAFVVIHRAVDGPARAVAVEVHSATANGR